MPTDTERLEWLLPVVTGLKGRDAIDHCMEMESDHAN
jgi:hypothetical protein